MVRVEKPGVVKGPLVGRDLDMTYAQIASSIEKAALIAGKTPHNPEAKLRELVSPLWQEFLKKQQLTLAFEPRDEYVLANGTPDTVYNRLILEYKKPGTIKADNEKNRVVIAKVQGYIDDLAKKEGWKAERLLGVAFDGEMFLFIRKGRRWIVQNPVAVTSESVEYFLTNLVKLTGGLPLLPEYLIRDFAVGITAESAAVKAIKAFYNSAKKTEHPRARAFFEQWALQFSEVHGSLKTKKFDTDTHLRSYGFSKNEQASFDFLAFFFALDTYYAVLMKLLAYQVVGHYTLSGLVGLPLGHWEQLDSPSLLQKLREVEDGGVFRSLGIRNFLEGDLLSWYLDVWSDSIEGAVREITKRLNSYDPETMELFPDETRDILKKLYQFLVPKQIRHDLGEYYTPDWLAERCLDQVGYGPKERNLLKLRLLDPGCGSGTFLILAIKRAKEHANQKGVQPGETLNQITKNIVGFDLNPLAVISARTNYLLAVAELLKHKTGEFTIPIYLCDSICPPSAKQQPDLLEVEAGHYTISTSVGAFQFPSLLVKREHIQAVTPILEDAVKTNLSTDKLLARVESELGIDKLKTKKFEAVLGKTFHMLVELEAKGINGIWARVIKNAFAPLFVGEFDFVVGNPPWVNWEDLPPSYREQTKTLWREYGLFSLTGHEARLGGGKKDISMLMMYVAIDRYLKDKCKLCFVITQTLFKTQGAGDGFRRFRLGQNGAFFRIEQLDDLSELQPFEGATNRTSIVLCTKGERTKYPLPYLLWRKKEKGKIDVESRFDEVLDATLRRNLKAQPVGQSETSPWISAKPKALVAAKKVIGEADYTAYAGSCTWMNGVYWGRIAPSRKGFIRFANLCDEGKIKIPEVEEEIEATLVYPLLRGREVSRWHSAPEFSLIVSQNPEERTGYELKWMEKHVPKTLEYFKRFKSILIERSGYKKYLASEPFYSIYNVSEKTFALFKVVWKEQSSQFECAVVSSVAGKTVIPDHKLMLVPFHDGVEAHYVCALLNSTIARFIVLAYTISTQQSTHILENVRIPRYDANKDAHKDLARLSEECHGKAAAGIDVSDLEEHIDELAAGLWGLSKEELKDITESLEEMQ